MRAVLVAFLALCMGASPLLAAGAKVSAKTEAAVKVFEAVGADPAKLKIFCGATKVMEQAGDNPSSAAQAQIASYIKQLGPDFEVAWNTAGRPNDNSADGRAYNAAIDGLFGKCQ
jgi:hypothetical protein